MKAKSMDQRMPKDRANNLSTSGKIELLKSSCESDVASASNEWIRTAEGCVRAANTWEYLDMHNE